MLSLKISQKWKIGSYKFLFKKSGVPKYAEFYAEFKSVEKASKKFTQKSYKPKTLMPSSKSWKNVLFSSLLSNMYL